MRLTSSASRLPLLALSMAATAMGDYVSRHNALRCLHCDTPVAARSPTLEADARAYAATCPTAHASNRDGSGENLYWVGFSSPPSEDQSFMYALSGWYADEETNYDYQAGTSNGGVTGHFTQVIWKASVEVGCAVNISCNNMFSGVQNSVVVCRYREHGNSNNYLAQVGHRVSAGSQCSASHSSCPAGGGGSRTGGINGGNTSNDTEVTGGSSGSRPEIGSGSRTGSLSAGVLAIIIFVVAALLAFVVLTVLCIWLCCQNEAPATPRRKNLVTSAHVVAIPCASPIKGLAPISEASTCTPDSSRNSTSPTNCDDSA